MSNGIPLTDENRLPWLTSLNDHLLSWQNNHLNGVLACSALKVKYRQFLSQNLNDLKFILLNVHFICIHIIFKSLKKIFI